MDYNQQEPHLFDYIEVLRRRRWIVIAAFLGTLLSTGIFTFTATPIYEASTIIQIEEKKGPTVSFSELPINLGLAQLDPLKTEAEIMKSRTIIGRVVEGVLPNEGDEQSTLQKRIEGLQRVIKAEPIKGTNLLRISLQNEDPERAAKILNRLSYEYIEQNLNVAKAEASQAKGFVEKQLETVKADLDNSQSDMERFKSREGVTILSEDMKTRVDRLSEVETKRVQVEMERKALEAILLSLESNKGSALTGTNMTNPAVAEFGRRLAELQVQRASLLNYHTEDHPSIIKINMAIKEAKLRLKEEAERALGDLRTKEKTLVGIIGGYEEEIKKLPQAEQELTNIMRTLTVSEGIYTFLLKKEKEAEIAMASEVGNIRVIDAAIPPEKPIKPNKTMNIILGAIVGLFLGIGLSFFIEYMDDTVKGRDETERRLALPVFGILPLIGHKNGFLANKKRLAETQQRNILLMAQERPRSYIMEAYRALRTNIQFFEMEKRNQVIIITSSIMGEGKSITAANLGSVFAMDGARTLIIDADLRRPMQHKIFNSPQEPGLTNILTGRLNWSEALFKPGLEALSLIPSGPIPPNPTELLGARKMDELLVSLKESFDIIIIDTPPVVGLTDAMVLGQKADGIFILIEVDKTPIKLALQARDSLKMVKANIAGSILNKVPMERDGYGYGYGYNYYNSYNEDGEEEKRASFLKRWLNKKEERHKTKV